ncbi:replication initiation protein, partial [Shigella sonnei]|nr:replication initiation protein [Shigella sonnei]
MLSAVIDSLSAVHRMLPTVFGILSAANQVCCQRLNDKGVHMSTK